MSKKKKKEQFLSALDLRAFQECIDEYVDIVTRIENHSPISLSGHRTTKLDWKADFDIATEKVRASSELFRRLLAGETPVDDKGNPLVDDNLIRGTVTLLKKRRLWPVGSYFLPSGARRKKHLALLPSKKVYDVTVKDTGIRRFDETGAPLVKTYSPEVEVAEVVVTAVEAEPVEQQQIADFEIDLSTVDDSAFARQEQAF